MRGLGEPEHDIDDLDGCEDDFVAYADDDDTVEMRPLFPDGDASIAPLWREVFD